MTTTNTNKRDFNFALSVLLTEAGKLQLALTVTDYATALTLRLGATAATDFQGLIQNVKDEIIEQSGQSGDAGDLTQEQVHALYEMRRLAAGARRTASLALKGQTVILHDEFQIGQSEDDSTLGGEVGRAAKTQAASVKYAAALLPEGWLATDSTDLGSAVGILEKANFDHLAAQADGTKFTTAVVLASNKLYAGCLRVQNAVRLQFPLPRPGLDIPETTVGARSRFLLESFPPRDRSTPDGNPPAPAPTPTPVPAPPANP